MLPVESLNALYNPLPRDPSQVPVKTLLSFFSSLNVSLCTRIPQDFPSYLGDVMVYLEEQAARTVAGDKDQPKGVSVSIMNRLVSALAKNAAALSTLHDTLLARDCKLLSTLMAQLTTHLRITDRKRPAPIEKKTAGVTNVDLEARPDDKGMMLCSATSSQALLCITSHCHAQWLHIH